MKRSSESEIIEKIRKLLALAERGGTEEEATAALEKAQALMTQHGIESVSVKQEDDKPRALNIVEEELQVDRDKCETDLPIAAILEQCYGVRILWSTTYTQVREKDKMWKTHLRRRRVFYIVGDQFDVIVAKSIINPAHRIMRALTKKYLKDTGQTWNSSAVTAFLLGLQSSFILANKKIREQTQLAAGEAGNAYALAVVDKRNVINNHIKQNIITVAARNTGPRPRFFDDSAYSAGRQAGEKLNLNPKKLR